MKTLHQSLGRYLIEAEIGRGAMGVVYRAYDPQIGRTVAIKTISLAGPEFTSDDQYRERFMRETRAAGRLSHAGIVTVFDAGEDPDSGDPYLVMEYIAGEPLSKVLSRHRKLPLHTALQYAQEIAEALDYAHTQGVVHRDVKPANILISEDGHAKITDFGVAWLNHEMTQAGEIVGSPAYMAPEQMAGKQADARSDLFSLGVVLYCMITGFRPFQGNSAKTVVFKVMNIEPLPVSSFQSEIPPELNAIVSRAIAKNPDERYPSGAALARAIKAFRESDAALNGACDFPGRALQGEGIRFAPQMKPGGSTSISRLAFGLATIGVAVTGSVLVWRMARVRDLPVPTPKPAEMSTHSARSMAAIARIVAEKNPVKKKSRSRNTLLSPVPVLAPKAPRLQPAKVEIEIRHHFNQAKASVWLDDDLVFDRNLAGAEKKHLLGGTEVDEVTDFQFAPGRHWLQVRIVSPGNNYDQVEILETDLNPGSEHVLHVDCEKHKIQMSLDNSE